MTSQVLCLNALISFFLIMQIQKEMKLTRTQERVLWNQISAWGGRALLKLNLKRCMLKLEMQNSSVLLFSARATRAKRASPALIAVSEGALVSERGCAAAEIRGEGAEGWCARAAHPLRRGLCARATRPQPLSVSGPTGVESMSAAAAASDKTNNNTNTPIVAVGGEWMASWWCLMCHKNRHGQFEFCSLVHLLQ